MQKNTTIQNRIMQLTIKGMSLHALCRQLYFIAPIEISDNDCGNFYCPALYRQRKSSQHLWGAFFAPIFTEKRKRKIMKTVKGIYAEGSTICMMPDIHP